MTVLRNYSYPATTNKICVSGELEKREFNNNGLDLKAFHVFPEITPVVPLWLNDTSANMRFVSCGTDRGKETLAFSQLLVVFEN